MFARWTYLVRVIFFSFFFKTLARMFGFLSRLATRESSNSRRVQLIVLIKKKGLTLYFLPAVVIVCLVWFKSYFFFFLKKNLSNRLILRSVNYKTLFLMQAISPLRSEKLFLTTWNDYPKIRTNASFII